MKKPLIQSIMFLVLILFLAACNSNESNGDQSSDSENDSKEQSGGTVNINFGTAGDGGTQYFVGAGIAEAINKNVEGVNVTAQASRGGLENMRNLSNDQIDMGFSTGGTVWNAKDDETLDKEKLMVMLDAYPSAINLVVPADSDLKTTDDLFQNENYKNYKIGIGEPGSSIQDGVAMILSLYDLKLEDLPNIAPLSQTEQASLMKDRDLDVAYLGGGMPITSVTDLATSMSDGIRILEFSDYAFERIEEIAPQYAPLVVKPGTYPGIDEEITTTASTTPIFVHKDLSEEVVYNMTKAILEHNDDIASVHPIGEQIVLEDALKFKSLFERTGYKHHPGAIKYFEEKGVWK